MELAERIHEHRIQIPETAREELSQLYESLARMFEQTLKALETQQAEFIEDVLALEEKINRFEKSFTLSHISRLEQGECSAAAGVAFQDVVANLEKVGDHLTNVAESVHVPPDHPHESRWLKAQGR